MLDALKQNGISAWDIGEVTEKDRLFIRKNGEKQPLAPVAVDPFWAAYFSTLQE
jgi:hydrogenase maturation factor